MYQVLHAKQEKKRISAALKNIALIKTFLFGIESLTMIVIMSNKFSS